MSRIEMKIKKLILIRILFASIISFSSAANFYISPEYTWFASKCETAIDIMIDSEWENVAAADMMLIFDTWAILPLCFIPWDFLNIGGWMEIDWNKIKVTSYQYPWYSKWKWKFGTLIFRPFSTIKETTLYFDVKKIWLKETAWDSNISRPWWWDLLDKAWFAKYTFEEWTCEKIDYSKLGNCQIYDNSGSFETFIKKYEKDVKIESIDYKKIIIRFLLLLIILLAIIRRFTKKIEDKTWKN